MSDERLTDNDTALLDCLGRGDTECVEKLLREMAAAEQQEPQAPQFTRPDDGSQLFSGEMGGGALEDLAKQEGEHLKRHADQITSELFMELSPNKFLDMDQPVIAQLPAMMQYGTAIGTVIDAAFYAGMTTLAHVLKPHLEELARRMREAGLE